MKSLLALLWGRTARNSALVIGSNIAYGILVISFIIITSRILGPELFGLFSICIAIFGLSFDILSLGTSQSLIRFIALHTGRKINTAFQFARAVFLLRMFESVAVMAIAVIVAKFISVIVYTDGRLLVPLIITLTLAGGNLLVDFFASVLQGQEKFSQSALISLANSSIRIVSLVVLVTTGSLSVITAVIAFSLGPWIAAGLGFLLTPKKYLAVSVPPTIISQLFHFSKWITLWSSTAALVGRIDILILGKFTSAYETGIYAAASRLATGFILIGSSYASVLTPKVSRNIHNPTSLRRLFRLISVSVVMISSTMALVAFLAPWIIPTVFGPKYLSAVPVFQTLTIGSIFFMLSLPANISLFAMGRAKFIGVQSLIQVTILVLLSLKLIPQFGAQGAAISLSIGYFCTALVSSVYASKTLASKT